MEQELNNGSNSVQVEIPVQNETKASNEENTNLADKSINIDTKNGMNDDDNTQSPEEKVENYKRRKSKEFDDLKRQLEEKERQINELINNPIKEGEVFDPLLGTNISDNLPASEYRTLLQKKIEQQQEQQAIYQLKKKVDDVNAKYPDAVDVMRNATQLGLINDHIIVSAANSDDGKGMELLYRLAKESPDELRRISSISNPYMQAVAFGERLNSFKSKPAARNSNSDVPPNNLNESGRSGSGDLSGLSKDAQYRAKLAAYKNKHKF